MAGGHSTEEMCEARRFLARTDGALARADMAVPPFEWRVKAPGFVGLVQLVIEQQVSTASAAAIWSRVQGALPGLDPAAVLRQDDAFFRSLGLSGQKVRYVRAVAEAVRDGNLDFDRLRSLGDAEAAEVLVRIKGIGRWTADAYLMGCEGRTDVFPAGDLALREGLRFADGADAALTIPALYERAAAWQPYRGVAAHLLWAYYAAVKNGLVPVQAVPER